MRRYVEDSSLVFSAAIILALVVPAGASFTSGLIVPALVLAMSLSMRQLAFSWKEVQSNIKPAFLGFALNYVFLSGLILACGFFLRDNVDYFRGMAVMAAVPPAVAVVPFTFLLGGNGGAALSASALSYAGALLYAPALMVILLGNSVDVGYLLWLLFLMIIVPFVVSRVLRRFPDGLFSLNKAVINICFAVISYSVIALNSAALHSVNPQMLLLTLALFARTFVSGFFVWHMTGFLKLKSDDRIAYSMLSAYKNLGAATVISLGLFGAAAAFPAAIGTIFELLFFIAFRIYLRRVH
ncbi:Uncharacterised protein [uncultured archaeon]|nr:Uncharacterised protein [uncultured archaeon]